MSSPARNGHLTPAGRRRRWLLGLEPLFEGGWLHRGKRARRWDVEDELTAVALLGDVTVDLCQNKSAPSEIVINAYPIFRDVDVWVEEGTQVEMSGGGIFGRLRNDVPTVSEERRDRVIRIAGHTLVGDVTARVAHGR